MLFDRNGKVLVENQSTFNIALVREQTKDLDQTLHALALATGADEALMRETVNRRRREPSYRPIVLIENAAREQWFAVAARNLPGIIYQPVPTRKYPASELAAHVFGYVGEVTEAQLESDEYRGAEPGAVVGHAGVEKALNRYLMGKDGTKEVIVNSLGREIDVWHEEPPTEGQRVQLTIDADVQKAIEDGFTASTLQRRGGGARSPEWRGPRVLEPAGLRSQRVCRGHRPGDVERRSTPTSCARCRTAPCRDATRPVRPSRWRWGSPASRKGSSLPTSGCYCSGGQTFYGRYFKCWKKGGHGSVDLRNAIAQSCDVYFYTVGNMLGVDRIHKWSTLFGLGVKSNIDLPNEVTGLVPSTAWKATQREKKWYAGETISVSIGQGQVSVTPISLAVYTATLANGGTRVTPHLLKAIHDGKEWKPVPAPPPQSQVEVTSEKLQAVRDGMWHGRQRPGGTGGARPRPGQGRLRQDRHGTGHLQHGTRRRADDEEPARSRLVRVLRPARQPGDRRRGLRRARHPQRERRARSPGTSSTPTSRRRKAGRCRRRRRPSR